MRTFCTYRSDHFYQPVLTLIVPHDRINALLRMSLLYFRDPSMQVALGLKHCNIKCDERLSNFAFNFTLVAPLHSGPGYTGQVLYRDATEVEAGGKAVQLDPIKPMLKPPGSIPLKLRYVRPLTAGRAKAKGLRIHAEAFLSGPLSNFAFNFKLRRYTAPKRQTTTCTVSR
jgi:hypothetical protein